MVNTFRIYEKLQSSFPKESAEALAHVFTEVIEELENTVTKEDFRELKAGQEGLAEQARQTWAILQELAAAQQRTEARVEELAAAQQRTEARIEELAAAQQRTEARIEELAAAQQRTEAQVRDLAESLRALAEAQRRTELVLQRHDDKLGHLLGWKLEWEYREKAYSYFGPVMRQTRVLQGLELEHLLEETLTPQEFAQVLLLDVVVQGRPKHLSHPRDCLVAMEVSSVIDENDLERAKNRAASLAKSGRPVIPLVAGLAMSEILLQRARRQGVVVLLEREFHGWEEILRQSIPVDGPAGG